MLAPASSFDKAGANTYIVRTLSLLTFMLSRPRFLFNYFKKSSMLTFMGNIDDCLI
ncbi:hypothetical protein FD16_GL000552 [Paucilactobacillus suebicus DSM 5007 = KCTC 3549]|uniref:Uncharacterized protein n=1 Tax=Paucilactobacillus suebicus DSM 5007 = KCTC 3549 TaxID=1423807 RepID=A0A0R1W9D7_9LACO|nr:hypothetical protein FD16_GL000552 [Paucilactobacillus suebicus DSM 5007 = KCTC 3549]